MQVPVLITVIIAVATGLACLVAGAVIGYQRRKSYAEREIGSAEEEARRVINDAIKSAENKKQIGRASCRERV